MRVSVPVELTILANKDVLKPEELIAYIWLNHFCKLPGHKGKWKVDFRILSRLSALSIKKLSLTVKQLEIKGLIEAHRNKGVTVEINQLPDSIVKHMESLLVEARYLKSLRDNPKAIPAKDILDDKMS